MDFLPVVTERFSLGVTAEALQANIDWKSTFLKGWSVSAKFSRSRGRPLRTIFARIDRRYNFVADSIHTKKLCSRLSSREVQF